MYNSIESVDVGTNLAYACGTLDLRCMEVVAVKRFSRNKTAEQTVTGKGKSIGSPPCLRLKQLRVRAGVTAIVCAKAYGLTSANSWYRYEAVDRMGEAPIPDDVIEAVMPILVGRGMPPVTADELVAVSSAHRLLKIRGQTTGATMPAGRLLPQPVVAPVFSETDTGEPLVVRYRAEKGVFMDKAALHKRTFGIAPITAARDVKAEQFCVLVADGDAAGTVLQCVVPSAYAPQQLKGRRVVMIAEHAKMGLAEVSVGRVDSISGNVVKVVDANGKTLPGNIHGVVIGSFARE